MRRKVLLINRYYFPLGKAGPAFMTQLLAEQITKEGDQAVVISENMEKQAVEAQINGVKVYRVPLSEHLNDTMILISGILDREKPDVVHTLWIGNFNIPVLANLLVEKRIRWVYLIQEYSLLCRTGVMFKKGTNCIDICPECKAVLDASKVYTKNVDVVVGVSRFTLNRHLKTGLFAESKQKTVISNCQEKPPQMLELSQTVDRQFRLGFLGRVVVEKGIELLIKEISQLEDLKSMTLIIAGECTPFYQQRLKWKYPKINLKFSGFVKQVDFFTQIDVCIIPSLWYEPLSRVVAESFAFGVPLIVSNRGGLPEAVVDGKTGLIFDPEKGGDLAKKIELLRNDADLFFQMKKNALAESEKYTPAKILAQYRKVYFPEG